MKAFFKKLLPFAFLAYGLFSVFTLQRDFAHVTQLGVFFLLLGPSFILFAILGRILETIAEDSKWIRYGAWAKFVNLSATQSLAQYILIFCLPFFIATQEWIYFGIHVLWLGSSLWNPLYEKMVYWTVYRHCLLAWTLICGCSFLFPFIFPDHLSWFYPSLGLASTLAFIPTRKEKSYVLTLAGPWALTLIALFLLDPPHRFPVLSVWTKNAHYELDESNRATTGKIPGRFITQQEVKTLIKNGHSLCCVAPVVAPPGFKANIRQEWALNSRTIESVQLKTPIQGSINQHGFHSFFCKKNFPFGNEDEKLRCRIQIGTFLDIGGTSIEILK